MAVVTLLVLSAFAALRLLLHRKSLLVSSQAPSCLTSPHCLHSLSLKQDWQFLLVWQPRSKIPCAFPAPPQTLPHFRSECPSETRMLGLDAISVLCACCVDSSR